jgi:hypothetical protein
MDSDGPRLSDPEDRRVAYQVAAQYELAIGQWRFQLLSIYIAAVGVVIGFAHSARFVGAFLIGTTVGLWLIELRNRDLLRRYRPVGESLESVDDGIFRNRGPQDAAWLALFTFDARLVQGRPARLISSRWGSTSSSSV